MEGLQHGAHSLGENIRELYVKKKTLNSVKSGKGTQSDSRVYQCMGDGYIYTINPLYDQPGSTSSMYPQSFPSRDDIPRSIDVSDLTD